MAADEQQSRGLLQLRWNSHLENLQCLFSNLLEEELFVDVTLACDGGVLRAHRAVLSACSAYFRRVLRESTCKHPTVIMKDIHQREMEAIIQFMYRGQIHVAEAELPSLLRTARLLEVRGFSDDMCKETTKENNCLQPEKKDNPVRRKRKMDKPTSALSEAAKSLDAEENTENGKEEPDAKRRSMEQSILSYVSRIQAFGKGEQDTSPLDLSGEAGLSDCDTDDPASKASRSPDCNEPSSTTAAVTIDKPKDMKKEDSVEQYPFSVLDDQGGSVVVQAVCPFCFKDCKRTAELRAHIRGHTGEKPFRCDICSAPFARSAHLKRHRRVHTGEKPFECHRCQKTFSRQDKLKLHMDRHRLRDSGGSKMIIGRPRKDKKEEPVRQESAGKTSLPSPSSASPTKSSGSTPTPELGMGQFAFPGAPARPGPAQSPLSSLPFGDINYLSLLSLSQRAGDLPSPTMPHLLSPQTLQDLQMMRKSTASGRGKGTRGSPARINSRARTVESASETLLNLAQKAGEAEIPATAQI